MKLTPLLLLLTSLSASAWDWNNEADVDFWAPGMGDSYIHMSQVQGGGPGPQYVGNYYAYVIKGIAGGITLGNRNLYDEYWQTALNWQRDWAGKDSWATVSFQLNNTYFTDPALFFTLSGDHAGATTGNLTQMLDQPIIIKSRGSWDTSITFVPHVNSWFVPNGSGISNKTPSSRFVVLADIYRTAPEVTGDLQVSSNWAQASESVTLTWEYDRGEEAIEGHQIPSDFDGTVAVDGGSQ